MKNVPTKVVHSKEHGGEVLINASDFDPEIHTESKATKDKTTEANANQTQINNENPNLPGYTGEAAVVTKNPVLLKERGEIPTDEAVEDGSETEDEDAESDESEDKATSGKATASKKTPKAKRVS